MANHLTFPKNVFMGTGALEQSEVTIKTLGKKAFIVTGRHVGSSSIIEKLINCLSKWEISFEVFKDITGEPDDVMIALGVKRFKESKSDFIIGLGGGSPLDSAKAISAMSVLGGKISDYMGVEIKGDFPKLVLIPTTSGTGSEATKFTVITDKEKNIKMLLKGNDLLPELAIVEPEFTVSSPKTITSATGMDALTHAVESFTSRKGNSFTDLYALDSIKRIFKYLPIAYENGSDIKAREELAIAAFEAGICINNASVTLVHGMSRPIGALFHVPHGIANAMLIKACLSFALDGCYDKFARIAQEIGAATQADSDQDAALKFIEKLEELCRLVEIPTLEEYGIDKDEYDSVIDKMATDAIVSGSPANTIKPLTKEDLLEIYKKLR